MGAEAFLPISRFDSLCLPTATPLKCCLWASFIPPPGPHQVDHANGILLLVGPVKSKPTTVVGSFDFMGIPRGLFDAVGQAAWSAGHIPGLRMKTCWGPAGGYHQIGLGGHR